MAQNGQLRARLALLTGRLSCNWRDLLGPGELAAAAAGGMATGGGVRPGPRVLRAATQATLAAASSPLAPLPSDDEDDGASLGPAPSPRSVGGGFPHTVGGADAAEHPLLDPDHGLLFAVGDCVRTDYGDGMVLSQNDATGMTAVSLTWGAVAYMPSNCLRLVALAGEEPPSSVAPRLAHGPCVDRQFALGGGPYGYGGSALDGAHGGGCLSAVELAEQEALEAKAAAATVARGVPLAVGAAAPRGGGDAAPTLAGVPCADEVEMALQQDAKHARARKPVFRLSWDARVPRGVPLRLHPARGLNINGFVSGAATSTFAGGASATAGAGHGVSWHPADASMFLADGGRASRRSGKAQAAGSVGVEGGRGASGSRGGVPPPASPPARGQAGQSQDMPVLQMPGSGAEAFAAQGHGASPLGGGLGLGAMSPMTPGGGLAGASKVHAAQYRAEVQRLKNKLRSAQDSRSEQRKRLTESRLSVTHLLHRLSEARAALAVSEANAARQEGTVVELRGQVARLGMRYAEAVRRGWVEVHGQELASTPGASTDSAGEEEEEEEEEEGDVAEEEDEEDEGSSTAPERVPQVVGPTGGRKRPRASDSSTGSGQPEEEEEEEEDVSALEVMGGGALASLATAGAVMDEEEAKPPSSMTDAEFERELGPTVRDGRTRSVSLKLAGEAVAPSAGSTDVLPKWGAVKLGLHKADPTIHKAITSQPAPASTPSGPVAPVAAAADPVGQKNAAGEVVFRVEVDGPVGSEAPAVAAALTVQAPEPAAAEPEASRPKRSSRRTQRKRRG